MAHPYPLHRDDLPYIGKQSCSLTFCTEERRTIFDNAEPVDLVLAQLLRAAEQRQFAVIAYCFMPDHVHQQLWQRYGYERVVRDEMEEVFSVGYIVANPVRSRLVEHPSEYPFLGSQCYTLAELLQMCEYSESWV